MAVKVLKNEKFIEKNKEGNYVFEHKLIQELGQSNVNAIIDTNKSEIEHSKDFLNRFDDIMVEIKQKTKKEFEQERINAQKFIDSITKENKNKIALEYIDKLLDSKKELINNFDKYLEQKYSMLKKYMLPQKEASSKQLENAKKTVELWEKHYLRISEKK